MSKDSKKKLDNSLPAVGSRFQLTSSLLSADKIHIPAGTVFKVGNISARNDSVFARVVMVYAPNRRLGPAEVNFAQVGDEYTFERDIFMDCVVRILVD